MIKTNTCQYDILQIDSHLEVLISEKHHQMSVGTHFVFQENIHDVNSYPTWYYLTAINHKSNRTQSKYFLNRKSKTSRKEKARLLFSFLHVLISSSSHILTTNNKNKNKSKIITENTRSNVSFHSLSLSVLF
jgi:hypothetical protein